MAAILPSLSKAIFRWGPTVVVVVVLGCVPPFMCLTRLGKFGW